MVDEKYILPEKRGHIYLGDQMEHKCRDPFICKYSKSYCRYIDENGKCKGKECFHHKLCFSCTQNCFNKSYILRTELDAFSPLIIFKSLYCNIFGYHRLKASKIAKENIDKWKCNNDGDFHKKLDVAKDVLYHFIMNDNTRNRSLEICEEYKNLI